MVLIFLVAMMLIGAVAIRNVTLEEKMAANSRNQQLAFQAAEQGLRYCETGAQKGSIGTKSLAEMLRATDLNANVWERKATWEEEKTATLPATEAQAAQCIIENVSETIAPGPTEHERDPNVKVYRITALGVDTSLTTFNAVVLLQSYFKF